MVLGPELLFMCINYYYFSLHCKLTPLFFFFLISLFLEGALPHGACGILVPQPGIERVPPAVEAPSPNH